MGCHAAHLQCWEVNGVCERQKNGCKCCCEEDDIAAFSTEQVIDAFDGCTNAGDDDASISRSSSILATTSLALTTAAAAAAPAITAATIIADSAAVVSLLLRLLLWTAGGTWPACRNMESDKMDKNSSWGEHSWFDCHLLVVVVCPDNDAISALFLSSVIECADSAHSVPYICTVHIYYYRCTYVYTGTCVRASQWPASTSKCPCSMPRAATAIMNEGLACFSCWRQSTNQYFRQSERAPSSAFINCPGWILASIIAGWTLMDWWTGKQYWCKYISDIIAWSIGSMQSSPSHYDDVSLVTRLACTLIMPNAA